MKALADRIIRAHKEEASFQMIIVIPLKPEFSGTWKDSDELKTVAYLNYSTILRGEDSFFEQLKNGGSKLCKQHTRMELLSFLFCSKRGRHTKVCHIL